MDNFFVIKRGIHTLLHYNRRKSPFHFFGESPFFLYNTTSFFLLSRREGRMRWMKGCKENFTDAFVVEYGLCGGILVNCVVPHSFQPTTISYDNAITFFCDFPDVFMNRRTQVGCVLLQISYMSDE